MGLFTTVRGMALSAMIFAAGCSTAPARPGVDAQRLRQSMAVATVGKLTAGLTGVAVKVRVTDSGEVGAYSWPDGTVELTRGLFERLDEDELAAAIAHELGHVLGGRGPAAASALGGESGVPDDVEARADLCATRLLARAGYPSDAMARTLAKVRQSPGITPACRARLARRIARLDPPAS
jgi:predicted Zn-dependent protease